MPIQQCPIDIPEGYEFVGYRKGLPGERYFSDGKIVTCNCGTSGSWIIVRPVPPPLQVGDWAKFVQGTVLGDICKVAEVTGVAVRVQFKDDSSCRVNRDMLRKQIRTVEPYSIDQCTEASVRLKSRHVRVIGRNAMSLIESIHIAGVVLSEPRFGFISYADAAEQLQWDSGEAFGTEAWKDAE